MRDLAWEALERDAARRLGFRAMLLFVFLKFSSLHEIVFATTGISLRVMYLIVPLAAIGMAFSGGVNRTLRSRVSWAWIGFAAWLTVAVPFSSWVGGSAKDLFMFLRTELLTLFVIAGTVVTWDEVKSVMRCAALGITVPVAFGLRGGAGDRLSFDFAGSISDSNYLAAHLLLLIPFVLFFVFKKGQSMLWRLAGAGVTALAMYAVLRTGSRGGMIAAAVASIVFLVRATAGQRLIALVGGLVMLVAFIQFAPDETLRRLMSFSGSDAASRAEAIESAQSRRYLLMRSIEFTFSYPIFGVGMGQFATFEGQLSRSQGMQGNWHATHNSYTQISSECGIPALLFYLAAIAGTFYLFRRVSAQAKAMGNEEIYSAAGFVLVGMTAFCTAMIFLSLGYAFYLPAMTGLAIAMLQASGRASAGAAPRATGPLQARTIPAHSVSRFRSPAKGAQTKLA